MIRLQQRGDTIVEVLIAILVVSVILSGAFVSSRRSQDAIRQSQERVEALKVAEGQVERLKAIARDSPSDITAASDETFCLSATNQKTTVSGIQANLTNDDFEDTNYHPSVCSGEPAGGVVYYSSIEHQVSTNTFIVHTRWDGVSGSGKQEVTLAIRIDP